MLDAVEYVKVDVAGVSDNGEVVQLHLAPSEGLRRLWARASGGRLLPLPLDALHVTLCASVGPGAALPTPPATIDLEDLPELVARIDKASVFARVSQESQNRLHEYVREVEQAAGRPGLATDGRVFHVSLANLTGLARGSIGKVWEFSSVPYLVSDYRRFMQRSPGQKSQQSLQL